MGLVPEGLVLLTSVAFLLGAVSLARQQVLVQELPAVEGLARVDVVCLDKTGTLTVGDIAYDRCEPVGEGPLALVDLETALGAMADDPNADGNLEGAGGRPDPSAGLGADADHRLQLGPQSGRRVVRRPRLLRPWCTRRAAARGGPLRGQVLEKARTGLRVVLLGHSEAALDRQVCHRAYGRWPSCR